VCMVAGVAAFGGGTLRDVLLDIRPFFWVQHAHWLAALFALCLLAMLLMRSRHQLAYTERAIVIPDAIGLGLFTALGTLTALQLNMPALIAVLMGVFTSICGGVLRDIVCNDIPQAFSDHRPYAIWAFLGGWLMLGLLTLGLSQELCLVSCAITTTSLRLVSWFFDWRLPEWRLQ
ncbi:MAG: hypothetical protein RLY82_1737, partial [Pseudomonadota bacterium]